MYFFNICSAKTIILHNFQNIQINCQIKKKSIIYIRNYDINTIYYNL